MAEREGFTMTERNLMVLSAETILGLRITGIYYNSAFLIVAQLRPRSYMSRVLWGNVGVDIFS